VASKWAVITAGALLLTACTGHGSSTPRPESSTSVSQLVAAGPDIAARACRRWEAIPRSASAPLPSEAPVAQIWDVANDATNRDLEFVILRDHLEVARLALHNGDASAWRRSASVVDADCTHLREGTYRHHMNDNPGGE
jgi:hypothetical protein